ncbi:MAG TPA: LytTR family DNA-binding domain-containing protein [Robiginitalea sp.]|nr:LytTR family DNA-binding domain-containing protein [Robiginitalea sp.]
MKVVIVEDELAASENLLYLLGQIDPEIEVVSVLDSVKAAVRYFSTAPAPDLVFMDIHLADGLSFEIFDQVKLTTPVIFTTAYNQYALKAFKVNSIDYLLKPIDQEELEQSLQQYREQHPQQASEPGQLDGLLRMLRQGGRTYRQTFLMTQKDQLVPVKTDRIAYFQLDTGLLKAITFDRHTYHLDGKLEDLEQELDPNLFYRANRQFIVHRDAVEKIKPYFNGKLLLTLNPPSRERLAVSKAKAPHFKEWMSS